MKKLIKRLEDRVADLSVYIAELKRQQEYEDSEDLRMQYALAVDERDLLIQDLEDM